MDSIYRRIKITYSYKRARWFSGKVKYFLGRPDKQSLIRIAIIYFKITRVLIGANVAVVHSTKYNTKIAMVIVYALHLRKLTTLEAAAL